MNSDCPPAPRPRPEEELKAPSSRLGDEKISDDSGTETSSDSALKPTGLRNPFWSKSR